MKGLELNVTKQNGMILVQYNLSAADVYDDRAMDKVSSLGNIVSFQYKDEDGKRSVTSYVHEEPTLEMTLKRQLKKPEALAIVKGLLSAFEIGTSGVPVSYLVRDTNYIYVNPETFAVKCILVPLKQEPLNQAEIPGFFRNVVSCMRFDEVDKDNYVARLLTLINADDYSNNKLKNFVDSELESIGVFVTKENGIAPMTPQEPVATTNVKVNRLGVMANNMRSQTPMMGGQAPMMGGQAPMMGGQAPMMGGQAPMMGGQAPMMGGQAPMMGGQAPMMGGQAPMMGGQAPMMGGQAPVPQMPATPQAPKPPLVPQAPEAPQAPVVPQVPEAPQAPEAPKPPVVSQAPVVPQAPKPPVIPQAPKPPVVSQAPEAPQAPKPPVIPQAPEAPQAPKPPVIPQAPKPPVIPQAPKPPVVPQASGENNSAPAPSLEMPAMGTLVNQLGAKPIPHMVRKSTGEVINITKPEFIIGKSKTKADYAVENNSAISREHCIIVQKNGVNYIKDNNSTNHTYVNGVELEPGKEVLLKHKTDIMLGDEGFTFLLRKGD